MPEEAITIDDKIDHTAHESASNGSYAVLAMLVIYYAIKFLKRPDVPIPMPPRARPFVALGLAHAYGITEAVVAGLNWKAAITKSFIVGAIPVAANEWWTHAKKKKPEPTDVDDLLPPSSGPRLSLPPDPPKPPPLPPVAFVLLALLTGCAEFHQAKPLIAAFAKIGGAVCERIAEREGSADARFSCQVVKDAGDTIGNMGTEPGGPSAAPTISEPFEVVVPVEQADAFEAAHRPNR